MSASTSSINTMQGFNSTAWLITARILSGSRAKSVPLVLIIAHPALLASALTAMVLLLLGAP